MATSVGSPIAPLIIPPFVTSTDSIQDMIGQRIVDLLTAYTRDSIIGNPALADYVATEIRQGLRQEDPVKNRIALYVHLSDPEDISAKRKFIDRPGAQYKSPFDGPDYAYEIGGGELWQREFTIEVDVYMTRTKEERDEARRIGLWVFGRAQQALRENKELGFTDSFGETALYMIVDNVDPHESGGPPRSFIWRGKLFVTAYTITRESWN